MKMDDMSANKICSLIRFNHVRSNLLQATCFKQLASCKSTKQLKNFNLLRRNAIIQLEVYILQNISFEIKLNVYRYELRFIRLIKKTIKKLDLSGRYYLVDIIHGLPAYRVSFLLISKSYQNYPQNCVNSFLFQRDEKTANGTEIYLWYHAKSRRPKWRL